MGQKEKEDLSMYDYNAKEYANLLGISTNALRMRRRRKLRENMSVTESDSNPRQRKGRPQLK